MKDPSVGNIFLRHRIRVVVLFEGDRKLSAYEQLSLQKFKA